MANGIDNLLQLFGLLRNKCARQEWPLSKFHPRNDRGGITLGHMPGRKVGHSASIGRGGPSLAQHVL